MSVREWAIAAGVLGLAAGGGLGRAHDERQQVPPAPSVSQPVQDLTRHLRNDALEMAAQHEAGHVAALREFGIPVWDVDIRGDGSGETTYPDHYFHDPVRDCHNYAVTDVAGQESAATWLMANRGYTRDRALAETESSARSDLAQFREDSACAGISEAQARQLAREIIVNHRGDIARTSDQLLNAYERDNELDR